MKNFGWKRRLAATLLSAGLLSPAAYAQCTLDTNQVADPSFENVDVNDPGRFTAVRLLSGWNDPDGNSLSPDAGGDNWAYPYSSNYSGDPVPPGAGDYHFAGGFDTVPGEVQVTQSIDVSSGACGTQIANGGFYNLSAFFSGYFTQDDFSSVGVRFLDNNMNVVGSADIGGTAFRDTISVNPDGRRDWAQDLGVGVIPNTTTTVEIDIIADVGVANHDGYVDLVDFQVTDEIVFPALDMTVNRDLGSITVRNRTAAPVNFSGYSIASAIEGVDSSDAAWLSIADNYDADSGGSVDPVNVWTELTQPGAATDLSEADLNSGLGTTLAPDQSIVFSAAGGWTKSPFEDLDFEYVSDFTVVQGILAYEGNGGLPFEIGDLDTNGVIDELDWMILRGNQHTDLTGLSDLAAYLQGDLNGDLLNNQTDFVLFVDLFDQVNGAGAFDNMIANLPEPSGIILVLTGGLLMLGASRRTK